jgi:hypothetical protein
MPKGDLERLRRDPQADPITQLLYSTLHTRQALDRLDLAIDRAFPEPDDPRDSDEFYFNPTGKGLFEFQAQLREQLARLASKYVSLGIEERQIKQIEDWSNILLPLFTALMEDPNLRLTRRQRRELPAAAERALTVLEVPRETAA